jgi:hypothetical protein
MRRLLLASCALAFAGCFVGIDTSLMNRDGGSSSDAGGSPDATSPVDGAQPADEGTTASDAPPSDPSLVGSWSFEEASGDTVADTSGHGHDGTLVGSPSRVTGSTGQGIAMSGTQRFDVTSLDGANFPVAGTFSMWFQFVESIVNGPTRWGLFDVHDIAQGRAHWSLQQQPNGETDIDIDFTTVQGQPAVEDFFGVSSPAWNHIVVTWDVTRYDCYAAKQGDPLKHVSGGTYDFAFSPTGQQFKVGTAFNGAIDEIRLYSRALTAAEVGGIP